MYYEADKKVEKPIITLRDIIQTYKSQKGIVTALQNINFDINEGEFICVLGQSGCGKSTMLKLIAGFLKPSSGSVKMEGKEIESADWNRGVVFQNALLYPWLNIRENVAFGLKMRKISKDQIKELTDKYLEEVNLKEFHNNKPYELSGGMKQRAALARVLVNNPRIILMDEPFGALDALTRQNMQGLIRRIWGKTKNTIFLITHDVDEALALGTRIVVMSSRPGKIIKEFNTEFTYSISEQNSDNVRFTKEYIKIREEILNIINNQSDTYEI